MPSYKDLFPDKWLKAEVIDGHRPRVAIEYVAVEQLFNPRSKRNEPKLVVKFFGKALRMVCNKTQAQALATICKSEDYSAWKGHEVVLSTSKAPNGMDTILISPVPDAQPKPQAQAQPIEERSEIEDDEDVAEWLDNPFEAQS